MKRILALILLKNILSLIYDEKVEGNDYRIYETFPNFNRRIFLIEKNIHNDYYEIINSFANIKIQKKDKIIATLKEGEESSFSFKHDGSNYILIFEFPSSFQKCGFKINTSNKEFTNILNSDLDMIFLKEREFEFIIINNGTKPQIISLNIEDSKYVKVSNAFFEENGKKILPINYLKDNQSFYNAILTDQLTFKIKISATNENTNLYKIYNNKKINLALNIAKSINKNITLCLNSGNIGFYILENIFNYINAYLYSLDNNKIFLFEDNFNIKQINKTTNITKYLNKFIIFDAFQEKGCFQIIYNNSNNNNIVKSQSSNIQSTIYDYIIDNDYFDCSNVKKIYLIRRDYKKPYINLSHNGSIFNLDVFLNKRIQDSIHATKRHYIIEMTDDYVLEINRNGENVQGKTYINCFTITFSESKYINLKRNEVLNYTVIDSKTIYIKLIGLEKGREAILNIETTGNKIGYTIYNASNNKEISTSIKPQEENFSIIIDAWSDYNKISEISISLDFGLKPQVVVLYYFSFVLSIICFVVFIYLCVYLSEKDSEEFDLAKLKALFGCIHK